MTTRGWVPDRISPMNRLVLPLTAAAALVAGCGRDSMSRGHLPPATGTDHVLTVRKGNFGLDHVDVWRIERGGE